MRKVKLLQPTVLLPSFSIFKTNSVFNQKFVTDNFFWFSINLLKLLPEIQTPCEERVVHPHTLLGPARDTGVNYSMDDIEPLVISDDDSFWKHVFLPKQIRHLIDMCNAGEKSALRIDGKPNIFPVGLHIRGETVLCLLFVSYIPQYDGRNWAMWTDVSGEISLAHHQLDCTFFT